MRISYCSLFSLSYSCTLGNFIILRDISIQFCACVVNFRFYSSLVTSLRYPKISRGNQCISLCRNALSVASRWSCLSAKSFAVFSSFNSGEDQRDYIAEFCKRSRNARLLKLPCTNPYGWLVSARLKYNFYSSFFLPHHQKRESRNSPGSSLKWIRGRYRVLPFWWLFKKKSAIVIVRIKKGVLN